MEDIERIDIEKHVDSIAHQIIVDAPREHALPNAMQCMAKSAVGTMLDVADMDTDMRRDYLDIVIGVRDTLNELKECRWQDRVQ